MLNDIRQKSVDLRKNMGGWMVFEISCPHTPVTYLARVHPSPRGLTSPHEHIIMNTFFNQERVSIYQEYILSLPNAKA